RRSIAGAELSAEASTRVPDDLARRYRHAGWWSDLTLADRVMTHAERRGHDHAYLTETGALTWSELADLASGLAGALIDAGVAVGDRVGVWMPDGPALHAAFLAAEIAGATIVGLGARAGDRELRHILDQS